jgi:23S rRNA (guanosine2251-2'-O)-methyltransferase
MRSTGWARLWPSAGLEPEIADPRKFPAPLDPGSVHQGAALEVRPLDWGSWRTWRWAPGAPRLVLLDRVSDPHNVGAILRSAEVFGARAVVAPARHSAPETGALAKTASRRAGTSALPARAQPRQRDRDAEIHGLPRHRPRRRGAHRHRQAAADARGRPAALVLGAEGPGLRARTRELCDVLARIPAAGEFGSLNVSNAAAVSLYALRPD